MIEHDHVVFAGHVADAAGQGSEIPAVLPAQFPEYPRHELRTDLVVGEHVDRHVTEEVDPLLRRVLAQSCPLAGKEALQREVRTEIILRERALKRTAAFRTLRLRCIRETLYLFKSMAALGAAVRIKRQGSADS